MKKISYFAMAATALLCACDPVEEGGTFDPVAVSQGDMDAQSFITFSQTDKDGNPAEDGNYISYFTTPATPVAIYNYDKKGEEVILATGAAGSFTLAPGRGSDPDQVINIRVANSDRKEVITQRTVHVFVKQDLDPEYKLLLGDAGKKSWSFAYDANAAWGNAGNSGNGAGFTAETVDGKWWGVVSAEELAGQKDHMKGDETLGLMDAAAGSYMTFDEDFNIASFTADGAPIRKGTYSIENYDPARTSGWQIGTLKTSVPAVLFPYSINEGGKQVNEFDIMYLDSNHMTLVYTKGNGAASWGEITYWRFINVSPSKNVLEGVSSRKWGWPSDGVEIWGNAGNSGAGAAFTGTNVDGKWWGVTTGDELADQKDHAGGNLYGDESNDAYMVFGEGKVASYAADGSKIRGGDYELEVYPEGRNGGWELGKLRTTAPALLFPWSINEAKDGVGKAVTEFDVMYMDGDYMTLVYTKGNGAGSWAEITYWRFKGE